MRNKEKMKSGKQLKTIELAGALFSND